MSKVSKVIYGDTTVIDITDSTVNANNLLSGEKAYGADGEPVIGALSMGSTINVTAVDSSFYGETLSLTNGATTLSTTFDNSGDATFTSVIMTGLLTLTSNGLSQQISIPSYGTYNITFDPVPEGATVTPTDDIQLWLRCAHIIDKSYTTLAEVLADRETFETLIADSNACDYMARSTTWAGKNNLVPLMTSNTTPSGTVIGASGVWNNMYLYYAFDRNDGTYASPQSDAYIGYSFPNSTIVSKIDIALVDNGVAGSNGFVLQKKVDNNWIQLLDESNVEVNKHVEFIFSNNEAVTDYRIQLKLSKVVQGVASIQFYQEGITLHQDAMALIGKYDYCSNALLSNATWAEAIANSDYFEEVLNVKVPVMTSNTTPSGEVSASSVLDGRFPAYQAFDSNISTIWHSSAGVPQWIAYDFAQSVIISFVKLRTHSDVGGPKVSKIQYSNDNITWIDYGDDASFVDCPTNATWYSKAYSANIKARYFRLYVSESNYSNSGYYYVTFAELQFYGRASKEVLIPLVPVMTSNTTPSGVCSTDYPDATAQLDAYKAFDGNSSTAPNTGYWGTHYLQYEFASATKFDRFYICSMQGTAGYRWDTLKLQGSNDGSTFTDIAELTNTNHDTDYYADVIMSTEYKYIRVLFGAISQYTAINIIQFYKKQVQTNIIHSCANDTIYTYGSGGTPIIVATTGSNGDGICDFSLLEDKVYTLYSTVAKDPSNLSNPYSKQVRITNTTYGCTTELYVMPDVLKTFYWYGYESDELEDMSTTNGWTTSPSYGINWALANPTHNTNYITGYSGATQYVSGVATKSKISNLSGKTVKSIITSATQVCYIRLYTTSKDVINGSAEQAIVNPANVVDYLYSHTVSSSVTADAYIGIQLSQATNQVILYAFWYE